MRGSASFDTTLPAAAERLPVKTYTTADGLAQNTVIRVLRDSRGFLWFCTRDGLSRFDGYAFTNYGMAQGLPHPNVTHLLEARDGAYWVATNGGGLARLDPASGPPLFTVYPVGDNSITNRVNVVAESLVCSVLKTRCPVSDAWIAFSAVSRSRTSPTSTISGS